MKFSTLSGIVLAAAVTFLCSAASAQDAAPPAPPSAAPDTAAPIAAKAQTDIQLADLRGGTNTNITTAMTEQDMTAINSGNRINANVVGSGAISLQDNALSGFSGIGNFVMNTGHNNNLQSSMSVTIIVTQ